MKINERCQLISTFSTEKKELINTGYFKNKEKAQVDLTGTAELKKHLNLEELTSYWFSCYSKKAF